jgi:4-hydroxy-tetrahydrodipicolinate synthase
MEHRSKPWQGVMVATALPLREDLSVDYDGFAEHCRWLVANGCDGVVPNGSLGEYQTLTPQERTKVIETAVAAVGGGNVMAGAGAYGAAESRRWAEQAGEAGCGSVLLLPPNTYRADERAVVAHYREVARAGVPIVAYNNPYDTKVDLTPALLARLHEEGLIVAVKEFSGDVRRAYELAELAPELDLLVGSDDALPASSTALYRAAVAGDLETALPLYRALHPLLRWDSKTEFVQAIKLSMDVAGRRGGPCRHPREPLTDEQAAIVRAATEKALAEGLR